MNRYALLFIFITALLDAIGFGIIMPVLPGLLMEVSVATCRLRPATAAY